MRLLRLLLAATTLLALGGTAMATEAVTESASDAVDRDPWQPFNRTVFAFNEGFDRLLGKPLARGYQALTPGFVDNAVTAFFRNLADVSNGANFVLQGEGGKAANALGRVVTNTLIGVGGVIDVASAGGLPRHSTGFGTTLGKWGAGSGPYLVLPFMGSSTLRETVALPVDMVFEPLPEPLTFFPDDATRVGLEMLMVVDVRADLLKYEQAVIGDRYTFLRDMYLQHRDYDVHGAPARDEFLDDE